MDRYLAGEEIDIERPDRRPGEGGRARARFYPVLPPPRDRRRARLELLELITQGFPSPLEHPMPAVTARTASRARPLDLRPRRARWWPRWSRPPPTRTSGRISLVRVFSGTLRPDRPCTSPGTALRRPRATRTTTWTSGSARCPRPLGKHPAADGQAHGRRHLSPWPSCPGPRPATRCRDKDDPLLIEPWTMPEPLLPVGDRGARQGRRGQAVARPCTGWSPRTRRCAWRTTPRPTSWCCGAWARPTSTCCSTGCEQRYGVQVDAVPLRVPLRETFAGTAKGHGRHVKQSGGHGQFAVCDIEVEPLPSGAGFEFVDKVVGGAVPRQFIPQRGEGRPGPDGARRRWPATRWSTSG